MSGKLKHLCVLRAENGGGSGEEGLTKKPEVL
jgi:hypothetical protein